MSSASTRREEGRTAHGRLRMAAALALLLLLAALPALASADVPAHPVVRGGESEVLAWVAQYESAPPVPVDAARQRALVRSTGTKSLLDLVPYDAVERDQGAVSNCWVWTGTGLLEAAHTAQDGVRDRLSVQWFDSNYNGGSGISWAGRGGSLGEFVRFYNGRRMAVPWSNANASYQDGRAWCRDHLCAWVPADSIATKPRYALSSIVEQRVVTRGVGEATARANIKALLEADRGVYLSFRLPDEGAWSAFHSFWNTQTETAVFNLSAYDARPWSSTGGAHAVLVVGYDDTDPANPYWLVLNSWGDANGLRPRGTFRLSMKLPYDGFYQGTVSIPSSEWETVSVRFADETGPTPTVTPVTPGFTGIWETESGLMNLTVSGRNVSGCYEVEEGRVAGTLSDDGRELEGTWSDAPSYAPPLDRGPLELTLSDDGSAFQGSAYSADRQVVYHLTGRRVDTTPEGCVVAFPSMLRLPGDPDGDGQFEDTNGNGRMDFADVVLLFTHLEWCSATQPAGSFDFNRNGRVDFADVVALYGRL